MLRLGAFVSSLVLEKGGVGRERSNFSQFQDEAFDRGGDQNFLREVDEIVRLKHFIR